MSIETAEEIIGTSSDTISDNIKDQISETEDHIDQIDLQNMAARATIELQDLLGVPKNNPEGYSEPDTQLNDITRTIPTENIEKIAQFLLNTPDKEVIDFAIENNPSMKNEGPDPKKYYPETTSRIIEDLQAICQNPILFVTKYPNKVTDLIDFTNNIYEYSHNK